MRAFVVGNGPSLSVTPLDKLIGDVSFAVNRIRLIYPQTQWRPNFYVRAEEATGLNYEDWIDDIQTHLDLSFVHLYCNQFFTKNLHLENTQRVHKIKTCTHYLNHFDQIECPHTWHMGLCSFGSSVNVAIQLAAQMGYDPIYLIGCDLGYRDDVDSHFSPEYAVNHEKLRSAHYANMDTLYAHMIAARSCPVPIYNATIGGSLEVYPRREFASLFR